MKSHGFFLPGSQEHTSTFREAVRSTLGFLQGARERTFTCIQCVYIYMCACVLMIWVAVMLYDKRLIIGIQRSEIRRRLNESQRVPNTLVWVSLSCWKGFGQKTTNVPLVRKCFHQLPLNFQKWFTLAVPMGIINLFESPLWGNWTLSNVLGQCMQFPFA